MIRAEASCNILDLDYDNIDQPEDATDTQVFFLFTFHFSKTKTIPCTSWEYDTSFWRRTIIMDFDLVCSVWETWKIQFFLSLSSFRKFTWESYSNKWLSSASCLASPSLASSVTGGKFVNMVVNDDGIRKHFIHFCSEVKIVNHFVLTVALALGSKFPVSSSAGCFISDLEMCQRANMSCSCNCNPWKQFNFHIHHYCCAEDLD